MRQTTLTQCFGSAEPPPNPPPVASGASGASGYQHHHIDGTNYLINDTTNHVIVLPPTQKNEASEKARSMSPLNLARESFEVTPSVRKVPSKRTATAQASNNFVLSENIGGGSAIAARLFSRSADH